MKKKEFYPFYEEISKIYEKNKNLLLEKNNNFLLVKNDEPLFCHIYLKTILVEDEGIKQVYRLLYKRINVINKGIGLLDATEMEEVQKFNV